jgi:abequosyltransferase
LPTLSICIPTYNRSRCLAELLDSILAQDMPEIEVVVSDDASPDDTVAVAASYQGKIARFKFIRQPENIGLDRNFLAVMEAASSDYIWLMGDDDQLEPDGARRVMDALERWTGICGLTVGVIDYDPEMRRPVGVRAMPATQRMEGVGNVFSKISELLGFMSALVVDREKWQSIIREGAARGYENYYVQVYVVGRIIERNGDWGIVQEPCVRFRTSNDQLLGKFGWRKRLEIDVIAYDQIADGLFAQDRDSWRAMRQRVFDTHVMARLVNAKTQRGATPGLLPAAAFLFRHYGSMPSYWTKALPTLLAPKWMIRNARTAYQRFSKSSGSARARKLSTN